MGVEVRLCCLSDGRVRESAVEDLGSGGKEEGMVEEGGGEEWRGGEGRRTGVDMGEKEQEEEEEKFCWHF